MSLHVQETRDSHDHSTARAADVLLRCKPSNQSLKTHISIIRNLLDRTSSDVERPLPSTSSSGRLCPFNFDRKGPLLASSRRWSAWAQLFTQRLWTLGYQEEALASIFDSLPADFCSTIQAASQQIWGVIQSAAAAAAAAAEVAALPSTAGGEEEEMGEPGLLECLEDIWDRDAEEGFIEFAFDPATQQRSNVILSSLTASLAGMHKEEVPRLPARPARRPAPSSRAGRGGGKGPPPRAG